MLPRRDVYIIYPLSMLSKPLISTLPSYCYVFSSDLTIIQILHCPGGSIYMLTGGSKLVVNDS